MIERNQDGTRDTGESGETYDQEMEANRLLVTLAANAGERVQESDLGGT